MGVTRMRRYMRSVFLVFSFLALISSELVSQDTGWHISPVRINIQMGDDRPLQLLDDSAQEIKGAIWSVDDPAKAEIHEEDGQIVLHAKAVGTVRVSAAVNGEMRFSDIKIWSAVRPIPEGNSNWGIDPIGREIGDLPAVPTGDGPTVYSLEQTANGDTYLRADRDDGIQIWAWLLPERTHDVELVCGDWLGGALISANHKNSYTLYTVGKDGKLRWQHTLSGIRKGHAYNLQHLIHVLSQSPDGTVTTITGLDEVTGVQTFELTIPESYEKQINVHKDGAKILCASKPSSSTMRTITSQLFVNSDGLAYMAFTQNDWELGTTKCVPDSVILPHDVRFARDERIVLWQIHPDGTYRSNIVDESKNSGPLSDPLSVASPTGSIIPDGLGGVLLSIRWTHNSLVNDVQGSPDDLIYRIDGDGEVVYKFPLPKYEGALHDDMVLGEDDLGFTTRGSLLIAFNVRDGKEVWDWESGTRDIQVFAALANGHCLVQTPIALIEVENANSSKQIFEGKAMIGWDGKMYRKHN